MLKAPPSGPLSVAMFSRAKHTGYYSMEKVFQAVHAALPPDVEARVVTLPVHARGFWRRILCIAYAARHRSTVNHVVGDISFIAPALPGSRTIVTVHDFDRLYRLSGLRAALFRTVYFSIPFRHCRRITAISAQVARELAELFPWAAHKTVVIPDCLPAGFSFTPKTTNSRRATILQVGAKPNKNLERLIRALEGLPCQLHVVGALSDYQRALLQRYRITYRNSVDLTETDLLAAYVEADIVSFVSTYEGFGLPILEANAIGRPVITSNIPPMSEVAGPAACQVDPHDVRAIRNGIARLLTSSEYRAELVRQGLQNVRRYSAAEVARQFASLYQTVARQAGDLEEPGLPVRNTACAGARRTS
ncbi:MAG TPA: glycosyltransferase family 1 protein [Bryobacteraceae bacterium]|nr:glycosyltransferase family 1 protein [Bryobacteraceae bacterium]